MGWRDTPDETVVREAGRMIADQTGCTEDEALAKLEAHAAAHGRSVADTAVLVVSGSVRFDE